MMSKNKDKFEDDSEFVSCMAPVDTDTVCVQKRSLHEYAGPNKSTRKMYEKDDKEEYGSSYVM